MAERRGGRAEVVAIERLESASERGASSGLPKAPTTTPSIRALEVLSPQPRDGAAGITATKRSRVRSAATSRGPWHGSTSRRYIHDGRYDEGMAMDLFKTMRERAA
jgi:hypothetical protein